MMQYDFNLKARIQGKDGECGTLAGLVTDPLAQQVTDLIIKRGYLLAQQRIVSIALVQSAQKDDVYLSLGSYELDQYPEYRLVKYEEPITGLEQQRTAEVAAPYGLYGASEPTVPTRNQTIRKGIVSDQKVIEPDMPVKNLDGKIGKVIRVVVSRRHQEISYLVVQRSMIFPTHLVFPITMVENVNEDHILVTGTNEALGHLPRYKDVVEADLLTNKS